MLKQQILNSFEFAALARVDDKCISKTGRREYDPVHVPVPMILFRVQLPIEEPSNAAPETAKVRPTHLIRVAAEAAAGHPGPQPAKLTLQLFRRFSA